MNVTNRKQLWKVRYAIILLGWRYAIWESSTLPCGGSVSHILKGSTLKIKCRICWTFSGFRVFLWDVSLIKMIQGPCFFISDWSLHTYLLRQLNIFITWDLYLCGTTVRTAYLALFVWAPMYASRITWMYSGRPVFCFKECNHLFRFPWYQELHRLIFSAILWCRWFCVDCKLRCFLASSLYEQYRDPVSRAALLFFLMP